MVVTITMIYVAENVSVSALAGEMVDHVGKQEAEIVVISAVPPFATAHARYLSKRVRARFPESKIIVGFWNSSRDPKALKERMDNAGADRTVTRLAQAVEHVQQLSLSLMIPRAASTEKPAQGAPE